jgi:hypothetical protein
VGSLDSPDLGSEAPIILGCHLDGHINGTAMTDCGATSQFIDQDLAPKNGLKLRRKSVPEILTVVDGRTSVAGDLTHEVTIQHLIDQHPENVVLRCGHDTIRLREHSSARWCHRHTSPRNPNSNSIATLANFWSPTTRLETTNVNGEQKTPEDWVEVPTQKFPLISFSVSVIPRLERARVAYIRMTSGSQLHWLEATALLLGIESHLSRGLQNTQTIPIYLIAIHLNQ